MSHTLVPVEGRLVQRAGDGAGSGGGHAPGGVFADLNNDGYPDLYLMRAPDGNGSGANQLFENVSDGAGGRTFDQVANNGGAGDPGAATGAIAADYDGDLDLYVTNFNQPKALLQNQFAQAGVLQFVDVTAATDPTPGVADDQFGVGNAFFEGVALDNLLTAGRCERRSAARLSDRRGYAPGRVGGPRCSARPRRGRREAPWPRPAG